MKSLVVLFLFLSVVIFAQVQHVETLELGRTVTKVLPSSDGSLWVGTVDGLRRYLKGNYKDYLQAAKQRPLGLITALAEGGDETIWVGKAPYYGQGIERFRINHWYNERLSTANELPGNYVSDICPNLTHQSLLISMKKDIGGYGGTIEMPYSASGQNTWLPHISSTKCLCDSKSNQCWVGTDSQGLYLFDSSGTQLKHYNGSEWGGFGFFGTGILNNNIYIQALALDQKNRLWVGLKNGGLVQLDLITGIFSQPMSLHKNQDVRTLALDERNGLWIGTQGELFHMDLLTGNLTGFPQYRNVRDLVYGPESNILWVVHDSFVSKLGIGFVTREAAYP